MIELGAKACRPPRRIGVPLFFISLAREEIFREEPEWQIACFGISVSIFRLKARLGREFQLYKSVGDVISLVSCCCETRLS